MDNNKESGRVPEIVDSDMEKVYSRELLEKYRDRIG